MKWHICASLIVVLCLSLFCSFPAQNNQAQAQGKVAAQKITVLSPMGKPPSIELKALAPRLDTLDGKTVYLVNDGYLSTDILLGEMLAWFKANMPKVLHETAAVRRITKKGGRSRPRRYICSQKAYFNDNVTSLAWK